MPPEAAGLLLTDLKLLLRWTMPAPLLIRLLGPVIPIGAAPFAVPLFMCCACSALAALLVTTAPDARPPFALGVLGDCCCGC